MHNKKIVFFVMSTFYILHFTFYFCILLLHSTFAFYVPTFLCLHSYIPIFLYLHSTFLHSYIPTFLHSYIPTSLHFYIPTFLHSYIPTFLHSYILFNIEYSKMRYDMRCFYCLAHVLIYVLTIYAYKHIIFLIYFV